MPSNPKQPKKPTPTTSYSELPSDGWPELLTFLPNRIIQTYCKLRKIDKISTLDALAIVTIFFALFISIFVISKPMFFSA
jgi:hypothetical protein